MKLGIPKERIGFLPKANNWWGPAGKTGPCGPDTEMFYWVGEGEPKGNPATHDAEWMEIWNDVFMQYNKQEDGTFVPLAQKNVDTGMGLERVAAVLQGAASVYESDSLLKIMDVVQALNPNRSNELNVQHEIKWRRIVVDHIKASTFLLASGILPSNVDQGYVLRKLIRRAIRSAKALSIVDLVPVMQAVIKEYGDFYPLLKNKSAEITAAFVTEEKQFEKTLGEGMKQFAKAISIMQDKTIDGLSAFHLFDTYGFPLELTKEMATEQGFKVDEAGFAKAFEEHQKLSRAGAEKRFAGGLADYSAGPPPAPLCPRH
jgi:alanyl-tRNA synthetase